MMKQGKLDHVVIPKAAIQEARERKSTIKYSFEGIINGVGMKSYKLEELDALSNNNSSVVRNPAMDGTFNINPMNATGGFSETTQQTHLYGGGPEFVEIPMTPNTVGGGHREPTTSQLQSLAKSMGEGPKSKIKTPTSKQEVVTETAIRSQYINDEGGVNAFSKFSGRSQMS
jgi:hypothetical protein